MIRIIITLILLIFSSACFAETSSVSAVLSDIEAVLPVWKTLALRSAQAVGVFGIIYVMVRLAVDTQKNQGWNRDTFHIARVGFGLAICTMLINFGATLDLASATLYGKKSCYTAYLDSDAPASSCYDSSQTELTGESLSKITAIEDSSTVSSFVEEQQIYFNILATVGFASFVFWMIKLYQKNAHNDSEHGYGKILISICASALIVDNYHIVSWSWNTIQSYM